MTAAPGELLFSYYVCKRARELADRWPRVACAGCDCKPIHVRQGILADEHKIDWTRPENQP